MADPSFSALLQSATPVPPPTPEYAPTADLPPFARAGVDLARLVLWFIAGATILLLILIAFEEFASDGANAPSVALLLGKLSAQPPDVTNIQQIENYQKAMEATKSLLSQIETTKQNTRDFVIKLSQLILISILLPILTALLGYIFGTQQSGTQDGGKKNQ